jgi:prevent-host-death family protein
MEEFGIRALKQNASEVVAHAVAGEIITITDRGRPVVQMTAIHSSPLQRLLDAGSARPPKRRLIDLPAPDAGPQLSVELSLMRNAEKY